MTEKEYKKRLIEIEITNANKEVASQLYNNIEKILINNSLRNDYQKIMRIGALALGMEINNSNIYSFAVLTKCRLSDINPKLYHNSIFNEVENELLFNEAFEVESFERNNNYLKVNTNDQKILKLNFFDDDEYFLETKRMKFYEEFSNSYTLFKNTFKLIKSIVYEQSITIIDDRLLAMLLICSIEKYFTANKYDNYMMGFNKIIDDFLAGKVIEINNNYENLTPQLNNSYKGFSVIDSFKNENIANHINQTNINEFRKLKKAIQKLFETVNLDSFGAVIKLDVTPIESADNQIFMWSYCIEGSNMKNCGGNYEKDDISFKTAVLKGLFKGLKAIVDSDIKNKNIAIKCPIDNVLKCEEKNVDEQENNSRRKTITRLIEDNKLLVRWVRG